MADVALVHDWLTGNRGGEKVFRAIASLFPDAPIYTLFHHQGSVPDDIEAHPIHTSILNGMPLSRHRYRSYLPLFPLAAETLIRTKHDLVISTSHAVAKSVNTRGARHWCFIHSPMRYVWDRFDDYFGAEAVGSVQSRLLYAPVCRALRYYDRATVGRVGHFVANSRFVQQRVREFYSRESEIIHPPVETSRFSRVQRDPGDFFLFFSALAPYKKADQAILACQRLQRPLVVLGRGPELPRLRRLADPRFVTFVEDPTDAVVDDHYARARALLFPGVEDFGIVPVEASASGLPVIGYRAGGLLDSQTDETCVFYDEQSVDGLMHALRTFESRRFEDGVLRANAARFGEERFTAQVRASLVRFAGPDVL